MRAPWMPTVSDLWRWSPPGRTHVRQALAAAIGMGGPVLLGATTGHVQAGVAASMGGLALSTLELAEGPVRVQVRQLAGTIALGGTAMAVGLALAPHDVALAIGLPAIAAAVAWLGGMSRPLAMASVQFIVLLTIAAGMGERGGRGGGLWGLFLLGALWTAGVLLGLTRRLPQQGGGAAPDASPPNAVSPPPPLRYLFRHWRKALNTLAAWQYPLRVGSCLGAAEALRWLWPGHHGYWLAVTVAVTLGRPLPAPATRTLERLIGTILGVLLAGCLLTWGPPLWVVVALIALLAAARPVLRSANYVAYATIMTPLILLILDLGATPSVDVLVDRLVATVGGCAIVLVLGYLAWLRYTGPENRQPPMAARIPDQPSD